MLKDNDLKGEGNSYSTEFRGYDPRIGRWWSLDPVIHEWESPYVSMGGNPIVFNDPYGDDFLGISDFLFGNKGKNGTPLEPGKKESEGLFSKIGKFVGGLFSSDIPNPNAHVIVEPISSWSKYEEPPPSISEENEKNLQRLLTTAKTCDALKWAGVVATIFPLAPDLVGGDVIDEFAGAPISLLNPRSWFKKFRQNSA